MIRTSLHTIVYGVGSIMTWLFIAKTIMNWSNKIPIEAIYYNYDNRLAEQYSNNAYFNDQVNYISPENCWVYFYKESPQILKYQLIIRELDAIPLSKESIKVLLLDVEGKSIGNFDISMNEKSWNWDCNYFEGTTDKISKYAIDNVSNIFVLIESQFPWLREI